MFESLVIGGALAFAAAVQPGPLQAFLLSRVAVSGWRRTLPASFAPLLSDGPIALLALTLLQYFAEGLGSVVRGLGGVVLLYFAARTFLEWRYADSHATMSHADSPGSLWQAVVVNFVNPAPYLGWGLVLGPLAVQRWESRPADAIALIASFYAVMTLSLAVFILMIGTTALLGPRVRRGLLLLAAGTLAGLAVYAFGSAVAELGAFNVSPPSAR